MCSSMGDKIDEYPAPQDLDPATTIKVTKEVARRLQLIKYETRQRSLNDVVGYLLEYYFRTRKTQK